MTGWQERTEGGIACLDRPGPGPVVVLLHGIGSHAGSFTPLLAHLPPHWRIIAWNAPGYGASVPLSRDWPAAADYAAALDALLRALAVPRCVVLGHSLGALVAAAFAASHRPRVARLVLASPALGHGVPRGGALSPAAERRIADLQRLGPAAFAAARAPGLVHRPEARPDLVAKVRAAMARVSLPGYAQAARMLASGRLLDDAARLAVPTDVIVGAEDRITPPEGARRAHAALPPAMRRALVELPGAGHAVYQQDPAGVARALRASVAPAAPAGQQEERT